MKYLRQYVESSLGAVIDEETENCARGEGHAIGTGQDTLVHAVTRKTRESVEYVQYTYSFIPSFTDYEEDLHYNLIFYQNFTLKSFSIY